MMLTTRELFDPSQPVEPRLQLLLDWLEARRGRPVARRTAQMLGYLLEHQAIAVPLYEIFGSEHRLELTVMNPWRDLPAAPVMEVEAFASFLIRFSGLDQAKIEALLDTEGRYLTLLGLTPWETCFESETAYHEALKASGVRIEHGVDGRIVFDIDDFARLAGQAGGLDLDDMKLFSKYQTIYYYALGIEGDEDPDEAEPDPSLPPFVYREALPDVSFPWQFEAVIGGEDRVAYEIAWHGDHLHHAAIEDERALAQADLRPSPEAWRAFWDELDRLGVWEWERKYATEGLSMGATCWSVDVEVGDRIFSSSGYDDFPEGFESFCAALRLLVEDRPFA